ncbi:outer membrane protein assembly factor BamB family protein [Gimesia panareensis]|uniref:outer membrane protein assembly factor BamB family protein n=1 Tax=Gimesia panareensis TaxID=2527978 RepID=UPI00118A5B57|nr:PQQ-binding-like beta-propeller repeat protein [Gimesia panareensis]QDU50944.1 Serine/threonine-protein kinase AfsK [Gimesia panareensis]
MSGWKMPKYLILALFLMGLCSENLLAQRLNESSVGLTLPTQRSLVKHNLERVWWGQATVDPHRDRIVHLTLDEINLYAISTSGIITAFNNENGKKLWSTQLGRGNNLSYPPVSNSKYVFITVGTKLYSISRQSGEIDWELQLPTSPSTSPTVDEDTIYIGTLDGRVYAWNLRRLKELSGESKLPAWRDSAVKWTFQTGDAITTPSLVTPRALVFASQDGSLYSVTLTDRQLTYQFETDAPIATDLAENEKSVFLASEDQNLYCLNILNGIVRWRIRTSFPIREPVVVLENEVYLSSRKSGLFQISSETGLEEWWQPLGMTFISMSPSRVYASDKLGNLLVLARKDGALLSAVPLRKFQVKLMNDLTDRIFCASESGVILCLKQKDLPFPIRFKHQDRYPILPEVAPEPADANENNTSPATENTVQ